MMSAGGVVREATTHVVLRAARVRAVEERVCDWETESRMVLGLNIWVVVLVAVCCRRKVVFDVGGVFMDVAFCGEGHE